MEKRIKELERKVEHLEFKIRLLFEDSKVDRILFENDITQAQYRMIMDEMDLMRNELDEKGKLSHGAFEQKIYTIVGRDIGYHFCEHITQAFMEEGRWEKVFPALYGHSPKY